MVFFIRVLINKLDYSNLHFQKRPQSHEASSESQPTAIKRAEANTSNPLYSYILDGYSSFLKPYPSAVFFNLRHLLAPLPVLDTLIKIFSQLKSWLLEVSFSVFDIIFPRFCQRCYLNSGFVHNVGFIKKKFEAPKHISTAP